MIVAITGGTGSVGRTLVRRHLEQGDSVRVLSRRENSGLPAPAQIFRGDLASDASELRRFADGAEVLYHCAAETRTTKHMMAVNVDGTRRLIEAATGRVRRWVQLGSIAVYGEPRSGSISEETPLQPVNVYGKSKADADLLAMDAADRGAFHCTILRPSKIFGLSMGPQANEILIRLISLVSRGYFLFIGAPGAMAHYIHVDGVVSALMLCSRSHASTHRVYNVSDDCSMEEFIGAIAAALGKQPPTLRLPEAPVRTLALALGWIPGFPLPDARVRALVNRASFSCARIERELGYRHPVSVSKGLGELVRSMRNTANQI